MDSSSQDGEGKKKVMEVITFPVPFALGEIKENITINTNNPTKPSKEQIINKAIQFHLKGNITEATKYYQYCIKQGFKDPDVFSNYGVILKNLGKLKDAALSYRKAIKIKPDYAEAHSNLGNILRDLGHLKDAELSTRKAIELNPNFAEAHYNLGTILIDLDKLEDAELSTRKAIELNPDFAEAHSNLGTILIDLGKLQDAESSTRKAIELNPDYAEAHYNLGVLLNDLGKLKEAELSTRKAIEIKPDLADAHHNLGIILRNLGKLQDAEISTRKAIELNPNFANAHSNLGVLLNDLGKLKEAELSTRKAIEIKPDLADAHHNLGIILRNLGKLQEAELSYHKAIELDPKNKSIENNLLNLLTIYEPKSMGKNPLYVINKEFKNLSLRKQHNSIITDEEAIKLYKDGLEIYKKYNLDLETSLSQVYKFNEINFNCKRHMLIFNQKKIIPEFCFGCYKVQVEVDSIVELIKLFLVFNTLELENRNSRKCIIECRSNISGFYKGLIFCLGLTEALKISKKLNVHLQNNIRIDLISKVKRGCSEYPLEFPKYKEIEISGDQPMNYNEQWRSIEEKIDKGKKNWGKQNKSLEGFNLNNFLIMRNWVAYAQKIGDESVSKITNEKIKGPKFFQNLKRDFIPSKPPIQKFHPSL